ncbi:MAG: transposase [Verrucomicrobia bacterium]|nr:transposase [Verrucomicrobiota bacterium]
MINQLSLEKKTNAVSMLCEGASIRSIERMTGIHRDTVMRLGVRMGEGCKKIMDEKLRNLNSRLIEVDEVWGFVGMKKKTAKALGASEDMGDVWTWIAIDAETKLVPAFAVGDRTQATADPFIEDLASRLTHRVQISTDALRAYEGAIERAFGTDVDYGSIVKTYSSAQLEEQRRYSPPEVVKVERMVVSGSPDTSLISTSYP